MSIKKKLDDLNIIKKERNSNVELLRIICILMILLSHYTVHNGVMNYELPFGINRIILECSTLGNIGVIMFILITGYFSISIDNPFNIKKLLLLYLQMLFYSTVIYIIFLIFGMDFSFKDLFKSIMPFSFNTYWFMTVFILLYIFSPFLNKLLHSLKRKEYMQFIVIGIIIFSILTMITNQEIYANAFVQFILFYSIGAYLKKYKDNIFNKGHINLITLILTSLLLIGSVIIMDLIGFKIPALGRNSAYFFSRSSLLSILFSISLFNVFINRKVFFNKYINFISSCVLGIYLISDNYLLRKILWINILHVPNFVDSSLLVFHIFVSLLLVSIICILIEIIRKSTIEYLNTKLIYKLLNGSLLKKFRIIKCNVNDNIIV